MTLGATSTVWLDSWLFTLALGYSHYHSLGCGDTGRHLNFMWVAHLTAGSFQCALRKIIIVYCSSVSLWSMGVPDVMCSGGSYEGWCEMWWSRGMWDVTLRPRDMWHQVAMSETIQTQSWRWGNKMIRIVWDSSLSACLMQDMDGDGIWRKCCDHWGYRWW